MRVPVYICSALRGDIATRTADNVLRNIRRAYHYSAWAADHDVAPFAPHGFFTQFLDDAKEPERQAGLDSGKAWLQVSREVWVFVVDGLLSDGMREEVEVALDLGIPVRWFAAAWDPLERACRIVPLTHCPENDIPRREDLLLPEVANAMATSRLKSIEARLAAGEAYEDVLEDVDAALGTSLPPRDRDAEEAWEGGREE